MPRAFLWVVAAVNAVLALAGAGYAAYRHVPAAIAVPIVAAFLLQISFYLMPGFPEARRWLAGRFPPQRLALLSVLWSVAPYVIYSVPTGVFQAGAVLKLVALCTIVGFIFVVFPTDDPRFTWQDLVALAPVAITLLGRQLREIYQSPLPGLRLEVMGQIMIISLGATAFLVLRRLEGTGYRFAMSAGEWKIGVKQFVFFLLLGGPVALATGFARVGLLPVQALAYPLAAAGIFLGMYAVVALFEELFFRGILQNLVATTLGSALGAQAAASLAFGLCHLGFRGFPNWRAALVNTILGWFCGQAYRERRSVVASSITHALVTTTWRLFFSG